MCTFAKQRRPKTCYLIRGLHCLLRQNRYFENVLAFLARDTSIYTMDYHNVIVCCFMENIIGLKMVNPYKPTILFVGLRQTVLRRLIRVSTVCYRKFYSIFIEMKNTTLQPLKRKCTGLIDYNGKIPFDLND